MTNSLHLDAKEVTAIDHYLDKEIAKGEQWKQRAVQIMWVALIAIGCVVAATALLYVSPIIPFALAMLIPVVLLVIALSKASHGTPTVHDQQFEQELFNGALKISVYAGVELGKLIYTSTVGIIVGLANAAVAAVTLPVAAGAGIAYLVKYRQVSHLHELKEMLSKHLHQASIPDWAVKELEAIRAKINVTA